MYAHIHLETQLERTIRSFLVELPKNFSTVVARARPSLGSGHHERSWNARCGEVRGRILITLDLVDWQAELDVEFQHPPVSLAEARDPSGLPPALISPISLVPSRLL
jgi:hypothetical protein